MVGGAFLGIEVLAFIFARQVTGCKAQDMATAVADGKEQSVAEEIVIISLLLIAADKAGL